MPAAAMRTWRKELGALCSHLWVLSLSLRLCWVELVGPEPSWDQPGKPRPKISMVCFWFFV